MTESTIRYDDEPEDEPQDPDVLDIRDEMKIVLSKKSILNDPEHAAEVEAARERIRVKRERFDPTD